MAEQDSDRSEEATPYKLQEARKKGSVARSADVTSLGILAATLLVLYSTGRSALVGLARLEQHVLSQAGRQDWSIDSVAHWLGDLVVQCLAALGPLFLALVVIAVVVNLMQTGPVFSAHPLKPDLDRINPMSGFKRIFSMRTLFEAFKSIVKLVVLTLVVYHLLRDLIPGMVTLPDMPPRTYAFVLLGLVASLLSKLVMVLLVIAVLDFGFVRWEFSKRMRMSKRDVKDESKNRDGDPRIRQRLRELRKEMLKRSQATSKVKSADVLITNPTRIAVALSYVHGNSGAPKVVAKGAGELARQMREIASKHQIPVVQNRQLARTLFREVDFEGYVPEKLYPQLAKIMVWVYSLRQARREKGRVV